MTITVAIGLFGVGYVLGLFMGYLVTIARAKGTP